jgi:hypothetical protein
MDINTGSKVTQDILELRKTLQRFPPRWDGMQAIIEMKNAGDRHWRQMEWIGFFAQYKLEKLLQTDSRIRFPGKTYGNMSFDFAGCINWDLKVHPNDKGSAILNDCEAIDASIAEHGSHGCVVICVDCAYDADDAAFKRWHDEVKGGVSNYEKERVTRGAKSRRRKTLAIVTDFVFIQLNALNVKELKIAQKGWRNSNGKPRRAKYSIKHHQIAEMAVGRLTLK